MTRALSFEASSDVRATTIAGLEAVDVALQAPEREGKLIAFVDDDNAAVVLGLWPDTVDPPIIWDDLVESIQHSSVTTRPSAKR